MKIANILISILYNNYRTVGTNTLRGYLSDGAAFARENAEYDEYEYFKDMHYL